MVNKVPVVLCIYNDILSGVTSWTFELKEAFKAHPKYELQVLNLAANYQSERADINVPDLPAAYKALNNLAPAVVVPNYIWHIFSGAVHKDLRFIGFCHADSEKEYYKPLKHHEPSISQFIAVSPECANRLAGWIPHRVDDITVRPYGVLVPDILERSYQTKPIRLVYGGRIMQEQKRVFDFIPFVQNLLKNEVDFIFNIVGNGPDFEELQAEMAEKAPTDKVRFPGRKPPEAMSKIWAEHDVFIQVSDFEGTSISMLEAMAQGAVPVVTEATSGVTSVITHAKNGLIAPIGDMEAMAYFIEYLASKPDMLSSLGDAVHQNAKRFSMQSYIEMFSTVLDRALSSPHQNKAHIKPYTPENKTKSKPEKPIIQPAPTPKTTSSAPDLSFEMEQAILNRLSNEDIADRIPIRNIVKAVGIKFVKKMGSKS